MSWHDAVLEELRGIRSSLDRLAAHVVSDQTRAELLNNPGPEWACGHHHRTRAEATICLHETIKRHRQENVIEGPLYNAEGDMPPNAEAGAYG